MWRAFRIVYKCFYLDCQPVSSEADAVDKTFCTFMYTNVLAIAFIKLKKDASFVWCIFLRAVDLWIHFYMIPKSAFI